MKIYLDTIGCRLNQAEIEQYAQQFRSAGHTLVANPEDADLTVINTCSVTSAAASDSRQKIRQAVRSGTDEVVVTGCWATLQPQEAEKVPGIGRIVPNADKDNLVSDILQEPIESFDVKPLNREPLPGARLRTRAFIKVQDGCDNRCAFCVTTLARGQGRSRVVEDILADIRAASFSAREVVLTGVHLGSWGHDFSSPVHLRHLVELILSETDVPRVRLSSLEPWDLDEDFFGLWENPRLCRHLHLPLQSGCDSTLRRMARKTSSKEYADLVNAARKAIPHVAVTTDVITGFPGESEAEFIKSLEFVRSMGFAGGHVFTYSERLGTAAARMPDQVPWGIRKARNARMRAVFAQSALAYRMGFVGYVLPVLWERAVSLGTDGWQVSGLTGNYLRVNANAPHSLWNQITPVRLTGVADNHLVGQIQNGSDNE